MCRWSWGKNWRSWNNVKSKQVLLYKGKPGHSATRQSLVSVGSPGHDPSSLLQARALILVPLPQVVEHLAHSPHSCHLLVVMGHLSKRQSLVSVGSPGHDPSFLLQGRALILAPLPQVAEH